MSNFEQLISGLKKNTNQPTSTQSHKQCNCHRKGRKKEPSYLSRVMNDCRVLDLQWYQWTCFLSPAANARYFQFTKPHFLKGFQEYYNSLLLFISQWLWRSLTDCFLSKNKKTHRGREATFVF